MTVTRYSTSEHMSTTIKVLYHSRTDMIYEPSSQNYTRHHFSKANAIAFAFAIHASKLFVFLCVFARIHTSSNSHTSTLILRYRLLSQVQFKVNPVTGRQRVLRGRDAIEAHAIAPTIIELEGEDVEEVLSSDEEAEVRRRNRNRMDDDADSDYDWENEVRYLNGETHDDIVESGDLNGMPTIEELEAALMKVGIDEKFGKDGKDAAKDANANANGDKMDMDLGEDEDEIKAKKTAVFRALMDYTPKTSTMQARK